MLLPLDVGYKVLTAASCPCPKHYRNQNEENDHKIITHNTDIKVTLSLC